MTETRSDGGDWLAGSDHAWRYFELHAAQRMTVFNFFAGLTGLLLGGIAASLQASPSFGWIGLFLGGLLAVLALVFWKLDQRVSGMIKLAEHALEEIEVRTMPAPCRLFTHDRSASTSGAQPSSTGSVWTFGRSFRLLFAVIAALGVVSAVFSTARMIGSAAASPAQIAQPSSKSALPRTTSQPTVSAHDEQPNGAARTHARDQSPLAQR